MAWIRNQVNATVCQLKANLVSISFVLFAEKKERPLLHVELKKKVQMKKQQNTE
jgi:hypothetical protein